MSNKPPTNQPKSPPALLRWALIAAGFVSLALGGLGVILPGLPTTPFVLLAGACFVRASPALHGWLLSTRWAGPMLRDWQTHRSLPKRTKWLAIATMAVTISVSIWLLRDDLRLQLTVMAAALVGAWVVWRIPTRAIEQPNRADQTKSADTPDEQ
jgi:uncharacterized membrane protein YbaN (DUF454 family)